MDANTALSILYNHAGNHIPLDTKTALEAYNVLRDALGINKPDVKVVYEFKLRRADGQYLDKSVWSKKGKTYKSRNNMATAIGYNIQSAFDRLKGPEYKTVYVVDCATGKYKESREMTPEYEEYHKWRKMVREDKNFRAQYIPEDWTIICIPVNTKADIIEMSAREFYKGKPIE